MTAVSVLCLGLGGTKVEFGAILDGQGFVTSGEVLWRSDPFLSACVRDPTADAFCDHLVERLSRFLAEACRADWASVRVLGVPFPGPSQAGLWFSNNLTNAFVAGVPLESTLGGAIHRRREQAPAIWVTLDAKCDAAGELYHLKGRLHEWTEPATVLNLATGIAAGFVAKGRVLVSDADIQAAIGPGYDEGCGQLGRHLCYDPVASAWRYLYAPRGAVHPEAVGMRLTDRLSGPALAARLALRFRDVASSMGAWYQHGSSVLEDYRELSADLVSAVRRLPKAFTAGILSWADQNQDRLDQVGERLRLFGDEVATELASAIDVWRRAPEWGPFAQRLVLAGGTGIHFLASSRRFERRLNECLEESCVERSQLLNATERESLLFAHQARPQGEDATPRP